MCEDTVFGEKVCVNSVQIQTFTTCLLNIFNMHGNALKCCAISSFVVSSYIHPYTYHYTNDNPQYITSNSFKKGDISYT